MRQLAYVFDLNKCIGCHTCTMACKQLWTNRDGREYMYWNNVETRPGTGYPKNWEQKGGGFDKDMKQRPTGHTIQNEAKNGLKNERYTLAMARLPDPHSASAQFFINVNDNASLDYPGRDGWGYCVFGKVIQGMDVVDKIKAVPTADAGMYQNVPVAPVIIESANITK